MNKNLSSLLKKPITFLLTLTLSTMAFSMGSRKACPPADQFVREFDAAAVTALAKTAYVNFRDAEWRAEFEWNSLVYTNEVDYRTYNHIKNLARQTPWIYMKIEKDPSDARCAALFSAQTAEGDYTWVKDIYSQSRFHPYTKDLMRDGLKDLGEILKYFELKKKP
jgi:hypothetical protein